MENYEVPPLPQGVDRLSVSELSLLTVKYRDRLTSEKETYEMLSGGLQDLRVKRDEMKELLRVLQQNILETEGNVYQNSRNIGTLEERLNQLQRLIELAHRKEATIRSMREKTREFMLATKDAKWQPAIKKYQKEAAMHLAATEKVILGDEMGLGKGIEVLAACDMTKAKKIIVFSNKTVLANFAREINKWTNRHIVNFVEQKRAVRSIFLESLNISDQWIILCNFEAWRRDKDLINDLIDTQADTIIVDEAHALKDPSSQTRKGIKKVAHWANNCPNCKKTSQDRWDLFSQRNYGDGNRKLVCNYCAAMWDEYDWDIRSVKRIYPMTGTVILNAPQEMWSLLNLIDPKGFNKQDHFIWDYCYQDEYYDASSGKNKSYWRFKSGGVEKLREKIPYHIIMRTKKELIASGELEPLPNQEIKYHNLQWTDEYAQQRTAYEYIKTHYQILMTSNEEDRASVRIQNVLMRLRQAMVWPAGITLKNEDGDTVYSCVVKQSIKLDYAEQLIRDMANEGQRVLLFSKFTASLQELNRRFLEFPIVEGSDNPVKPVILDGSTDSAMRELISNDFDRSFAQSDGDNRWNAVLANYGVAGQSLTFTGASQMIILDREWNPGREDQAFARINRIGQTLETQVHIIQVEQTVDMFMDKLITLKREVVGGLERTLTDNEILAEFLKELTEGTI